MMLCKLCKSACQLRNANDNERSHHRSLESLRRSSEDRCQICYLLWYRVKTWKEEGIVLVQTLSTLSVVQVPMGKGDYSILAVTDIGGISFICRRRGTNIPILRLGACIGRPQPATNPDRVSTTTSSKKSHALAAKWIQNCLTAHPLCNARKEGSLPTRLVQVSPTLRPVDGSNLPSGTQYVALSHCWGLKPIFTLRLSNLGRLHERIPMEVLPQNFQDAIRLTRAFPAEFIWIDSLCIIQDSEEDWLRESVGMKDVYSNCFVNLACTGFPMARRACFVTEMLPCCLSPSVLPERGLTYTTSITGCMGLRRRP